MGLNKYRFLLIVRIILLLINLLLISVCITQLKWFFSSAILFIVLIIQIINFFKFSFKIKTDLDNLLISLSHDDFSSKSRINYIPKFKESKSSLEKIKELIKNAKTSKEAQRLFFNIILQNIPSGVIVIKNREISFFNFASQEILHTNSVITLSYLEKEFPTLYNTVINQNNTYSDFIIINKENNELQLSYSIRQAKILDEDFKIVNFQNIKTTIEKNEFLAWNKLIRTMTHEIMNSVTPIISLSEVGLKIINDENGLISQKDISKKNIEHINKSFKSIHNKSIWLNEFIDSYRKLISIPQPKLGHINVHSLISETITAFKTIGSLNNIHITNPSNKIQIKADKDLTELAFTNVLKNAIEALQKESSKEIIINYKQDESKTTVQVIDSGKGIPENIQHQIFIPFFTTKENGSGIGLSVSKQIMQMQKGDLKYSSEDNKSVFTFIFSS